MLLLAFVPGVFLPLYVSPMFSVSFLAGFPINKLQSRVLHLHVFDYDRFSRDDSIGEIHLPLCQVRSHYNVDKRAEQHPMKRWESYAYERHDDM